MDELILLLQRIRTDGVDKPEVHLTSCTEITQTHNQKQGMLASAL